MNEIHTGIQKSKGISDAPNKKRFGLFTTRTLRVKHALEKASEKRTRELFTTGALVVSEREVGP